jgi:hypothetical protein
MGKELIILNPSSWSAGKYQHIRYEQNPPPPESFWTTALPELSKRKLRADYWQYWWVDLSAFHSSLKGWKLAGQGNMPLTVLNPREKPRSGDIKLSSSEDSDEFSDIDPNPTSLDLP